MLNSSTAYLMKRVREYASIGEFALLRKSLSSSPPSIALLLSKPPTSFGLHSLRAGESRPGCVAAPTAGRPLIREIRTY